MGPRPTAAGAATGVAQVRGVPQYKYTPGVRNPQQHMPTQQQVPMQQVLALFLLELVLFGSNLKWEFYAYCIISRDVTIRDAPKWKFLAEAEQNATLGRIPNTVFHIIFFFLIFCIKLQIK